MCLVSSGQISPHQLSGSAGQHVQSVPVLAPVCLPATGEPLWNTQQEIQSPMWVPKGSWGSSGRVWEWNAWCCESWFTGFSFPWLEISQVNEDYFSAGNCDEGWKQILTPNAFSSLVTLVCLKRCCGWCWRSSTLSWHTSWHTTTTWCTLCSTNNTSSIPSPPIQTSRMWRRTLKQSSPIWWAAWRPLRGTPGCRMYRWGGGGGQVLRWCSEAQVLGRTLSIKY